MASLSSTCLQVAALLAADPANAEYADIKAGLDEVIALTRDLVREAVAEGGEGEGGAEAATAAPAPAPVPAPAPAKRSRWEQVEPAGGEAGQPQPSTRLPPPPTEEEEEEWGGGDATTTTTTATATTAAEPSYTAPPPLKRGKVGTGGAEAAVPKEMPAWMVIGEGDDERERARKLKLQKSFKAKQRFAAMDVAASQKASSWQAFASGKGAKARPGFLSTTAKPSLFSTAGGGGIGRVGGVGGPVGGGGGSGRPRPPPPVRSGAPAPVAKRPKAPPPPPPPPA